MSEIEPTRHPFRLEESRQHYEGGYDYYVDFINKATLAELEAHAAFTPVSQKCEINKYNSSLCSPKENAPFDVR